MLTRAGLRRMKEDELRAVVLIPLLRAMRYQSVEELHGATEYGKDLVGWKPGDLGSRRYTAVVAKATAITGQSSVSRGSAGEVQSQIREAFGLEFAEPGTGQPTRVHEVLVVTNKAVSETARKKLVGVLGDLGRYVAFISGDRLWELCEQHLPERALWDKVDDAYTPLIEFDPRFDVELRKSSTERALVIRPRPGTEAEPLEFAGTFTFGDSPEDHAAREAFVHHLNTGGPVELPGANAALADLPEPLRRLLGVDSLTLTSLRLEPLTSSSPVLVSLEAENDAGDIFALPYIDLRATQAGREEVTLTSEAQPLPVDVRLVVSFAERRANLAIRFPPGDRNVAWLLRALRYQECISRPYTLRVRDYTTGLPLFDFRAASGTGTPPDPDEVEVAESLVALQTRFRRPLTIPDRHLTPEESEVVFLLHAVHRHGEVAGTWAGITLPMSPDGARKYLADFAGGQARPLPMYGRETATLVGVELPLGPTEVVLRQARLENADEVAAALGAGGDDSIPLRFIPGDDDSWVKLYRDWLAAMPEAPGDADCTDTPPHDDGDIPFAGPLPSRSA